MDDLAGYACEIITSEQVDHILLTEIRSFVTAQQQQHPLHPAVRNMTEDDSAGLVYNIKNRTRWTSTQGSIAILRYRSSIIGISCAEHGELHPALGIGGIRCWLDTKHRSQQLMSRYLLEANLQWNRSFHKMGMLMTFNDYNKWLYHAITRVNQGRRAAGISKVWSNWWQDTISLPHPLIVRSTPQWCVAKPITPGLDLDTALKEIQTRYHAHISTF